MVTKFIFDLLVALDEKSGASKSSPCGELDHKTNNLSSSCCQTLIYSSYDDHKGLNKCKYLVRYLILSRSDGLTYIHRDSQSLWEHLVIPRTAVSCSLRLRQSNVLCFNMR